MAGSGKTTILDTLYQITKEQRKDILPVGNITKIAKANGSTQYFDRGKFQSTTQRKVYYYVYTVAGHSRYSPLRKKIFKGTDGVIFVVDSQTKFLEDNIESLKELINVSEGKIIREIPMVIMLNKQDLTEVIGEEVFNQILKDDNLWFKSGDDFYNKNPTIYKTCAIFDKRKDIYRSFIDCVNRISFLIDDEYFSYKNPPPSRDTAIY